MLYEQLNGGHSIKATFQDDLEVDAVSAAFLEHNDYVVERGNTPTGHQKKVAMWSGSPHSYEGPNARPLIEKLTYFVEQTDEVVDDLLDNVANPDRIEVAGRRMQLGDIAGHLLESLDIQIGLDAELDDVGER